MGANLSVVSDDSDMSVAEKERLEIKADKKIAKMGKKYSGLVRKKTKVIIKKHAARKKSLMKKRLERI